MGANETAVSDSIREFLETKGFKVYRMQSGKLRGAGGWITMNPTGTPDLVAISPTGRFCAFETKTMDGKASKEQIKAVDEINKLGGFALIAHSLGDVVQALTVEL